MFHQRELPLDLIKSVPEDDPFFFDPEYPLKYHVKSGSGEEHIMVLITQLGNHSIVWSVFHKLLLSMTVE